MEVQDKAFSAIAVPDVQELYRSCTCSRSVIGPAPDYERSLHSRLFSPSHRNTFHSAAFLESYSCLQKTMVALYIPLEVFTIVNSVCHTGDVYVRGMRVGL